MLAIARMRPAHRVLPRPLHRLDRWLLRVWHRLPPGVHRLPEGPVILAGNHRSGLDPLVVTAAVDRPPRFLMAAEYYEGIRWARPLFDLAGIIPVREHAANLKALAAALDALRRGQAIAIFPEGMANPPRPLARLLPGTAFLAAATGAPIVPFRVGGVRPFDHVHLWRPILCPSRAWVRFGAPLSVHADPHDRKALAEATERLRRAILALPRTRPARIA